MASTEDVRELIEQVKKCEDLASDAENADDAGYWQSVAQTRATVAVAVAILALRDAIVPAAARMVQK